MRWCCDCCNWLHLNDTVASALDDLHSGPIPSAFDQLLTQGQLYAALLLSTVFSEKYKGRHLRPEAMVQIRMPQTMCEGLVWEPLLLARSGSHEAVPFVWCGDASAGDRTIYVAFSPLRKKRQFLKVMSQGTRLEADEHLDGAESPGDVYVSAYIKRKLDNLWSKYGFAEQLRDAAARYPTHRIMFSGISHGAALAQAAALRFSVQERGFRSRIFVASWNGYKWTNEAGSALVRAELGGRVLPIVLSRGAPRRWDSVAEFPPGFAPMPGLLLLDVDAGIFLHNVRLGQAQLGPDFASRMAEMHFAKTALAAVKTAMARSLGGAGDNARRRWKIAGHVMRAMRPGYHPNRLHDEGDDLFVGCAEDDDDDDGAEDGSDDEAAPRVPAPPR
mmetsp:Transcript_76200/g.215625  ORF Transcript_76200/g.215625 Transcript_76200/m.215625 type:complete len:388 (-) Transcript_76200:455-1618(-)